MLGQQLINGLMLGASYSLVAIGYTLIFGVLRLLHFAHGEVFMVGAFIGLHVVLWFAFANIYVAIAGAMAVTALVGWVIARFAVQPVDKGYPLAPLNLAINIFGGEQVAFPETIEQILFRIGPLTISSVQIFILAIALLSMAALWLFIDRTRMGRAIRATSESHETAALLGVDVNRVVVVTFVVASALAGIAGVLDGVKNSAITPHMGLEVAVKALVVMLLGGLGNVPGAMVGGILLGMVEILTASYLGTSVRDFFTFVILILLLLYRPTGLFGTRTVESG
ncbi:MAG: branched-chain amino acid ABC transporter permease [Defluviicoccus sp.]|nr:branched-chain amino acid ABC transporter permease [Defluviicoccus sp.]